jgi:twinkle protein
MVGNQAESIDRYAMIDNIVGQIRAIASQRQYHITLVIHPRKEEDNVLLQLSSIHGTTKVT